MVLKLLSEASVKAFVKVSMNLTTDGFYDPMASEHNTITSTYASDFDVATRAFVTGSGAATWVEAVGNLQDTLNEAITRAFG